MCNEGKGREGCEMSIVSYCGNIDDQVIRIGLEPTLFVLKVICCITYIFSHNIVKNVSTDSGCLALLRFLTYTKSKQHFYL